MNAFSSHDHSSIAKCRKLAEEVFGKKWQELEEKVYDQGEETKVDSWGIGNCHIDTAWLVRHTGSRLLIVQHIQLTLSELVVDLRSNSSENSSVGTIRFSRSFLSRVY